MRNALFRRLTALAAALVMLLSVFTALAADKVIRLSSADYPVTKDGWYSTMEEVAVYLELFDELPDNYITKKEAEKRGWKT